MIDREKVTFYLKSLEKMDHDKLGPRKKMEWKYLKKTLTEILQLYDKGKTPMDKEIVEKIDEILLILRGSFMFDEAEKV